MKSKSKLQVIAAVSAAIVLGLTTNALANATSLCGSAVPRAGAHCAGISEAADWLVPGPLTVDGDSTLGDAAADKLNITGNVYSVGQSPGLGKPVASSCGTSPAVVGGSAGFIVTVGTGSPTACTVTFATAFLDTPACSITRIGGTAQLWFQWSSLSASAGTFQACNSTACGGNGMANSYSIQCTGTSINPASP